MLVSSGPFQKRLLHSRRVSDFYNLILFMDENEQNIENWQIKINNFCVRGDTGTVERQLNVVFTCRVENGNG